MKIYFLNKIYDTEDEGSISIDNLINLLSSYPELEDMHLRCEFSPGADIAREIKSFHQIVFQKSPDVACKLKLVEEYEDEIHILPLYERMKFFYQMQPKIHQVLSEDSSDGEELRINQAKLRTLKSFKPDRGVRRVKWLSLEERAEKYVSSSIAPEEDVVRQVVLTDDEQDRLVCLDNLHEKLDDFYSQIIPLGTSSLEDIWHNLVGRHAKHVKPIGRVIAAVDIEVMQEMIRNYRQLSFGIVNDNAPIVFDDLGKIRKVAYFLDRNRNGQGILRFATEADGVFESSKFTLKLSKKSYLPTRRCYSVVELEELFSGENISANFRQLLNSRSHDVSRLILKQLDILEQSPCFKEKEGFIYRSLADVVVVADYTGLLLVLKQINAMDIELLQDFFITEDFTRESFLHFATPNGLDRLNRLANFSDDEKIWWKELVGRHAASGASMDFADLFDAFEYFLIKMNEGGNTLGPNFPFTNIASLNMQVALERILYIVNHGPKHKQIHALTGLDLSSMGAYFASRYEWRSLIIEEMRIDQEHGLLREVDEDTLTFTYDISDDKTFAEVMRLDRFSYADIEAFYYRYVTSKRIIDKFDLNCYRKMASDVSVLEEIDETTKSSLLYIAAVAGTSRRASDKITPPTDDLSYFLKSIKDFAVRSEIEFKDVVSALHNGDLNSNTCPTLLELGHILNLATGSFDGNTFIHNIFFLIREYPDIAYDIFDDYEDFLQKKDDLHAKKLSFDVVVSLNNLVSSHESIQIEFPNDENIQKLIVRLLSLVVKDDEKDRDDSYTANVSRFLNFIKELDNDSLRKRILEKLCQFNIKKSTNFLTVHKLLAFTNAVDSEVKRIGSDDRRAEDIPHEVDITIDKVDSAIDMVISYPLYQGIELTRKPAKRHQFSVVTAYKKFIETYNLEDFVNNSYRTISTVKISKFLSDEGMNAFNRIINDLREFIEKLNSPSPDEEYLLGFFDTCDASLNDLRRSLGEIAVGIVKPAVIFSIDNSAKISDDEKNIIRPVVKEYFERKSLIVFTSSIFNETFLGLIEEVIKVFKITDPNFYNYLLDFVIKEEDFSSFKTIKDFILNYYAKLELLIDFTNDFINLKEDRPQDYAKCFVLLNSHRDQLSCGTSLSLFLVLKKLYGNNCLFDKLSFVFSELDRVELNLQTVRLENILVSLKVLEESKGKLSSDEFEKFFNMSVSYGAHNDTAFPLELIINLQGIPEDISRVFSESFAQLTSLLSDDDNAKFINKTKELVNLWTGKDIVRILIPLQKAFAKSQAMTAVYFSMLENLGQKEEADIKKLAVIFAALDSEQNENFPETILTLSDIGQILSGLDKHSQSLEQITQELFESPPYPKKEDFIAMLARYDLADSISEFDKHPYGEANRIKMESNFSTERVAFVVANIESLIGHDYLSAAEQEKLIRDFFYVNEIGKGNLPIRMQGEHQEVTSYNIRNISRLELKNLAKNLIQKFSKVEEECSSDYLLAQGDDKHRLVALHLLAVMRELYYRSTGILPNSTQILTIINALDNPNRQLVGINTGEGKSIMIALYSSLMCAKGCTVFAPTANKNLVQQDYYGKHNDRYFKALGLDSVVLDSEDESAKHKSGGINYGVSSYIDSYLLDWQLIDVISDSEDDVVRDLHPLCLVMDEYDTRLDDLAERSIVVEDEVWRQTSDLSPTWIITEINRFVELKISRKASRSSSEDDDLKDLKSHLAVRAQCQVNHTIDAFKQLADLSVPKLKFYLESAFEAHALAENIDFKVLTRRADGSAIENHGAYATPIGPLGIERGMVVQPFLHDILNRSRKYAYTFPVEFEPITIATDSSINLMKRYKYIIGLTATPGSQNELLEQYSTLGMHPIRIPPHKDSHRRTLSPILVSSIEEKHAAIIRAIRFNGYEDLYLPTFILDFLVRATQLYYYLLHNAFKLIGFKVVQKAQQPILIPVDTIDEAVRLGKILKARLPSFTVQTVDSSETESEFRDKIEKSAKENMITVGTSADLGRGMDYSPKHPDGMFLIDASASTPRSKKQNSGRVARNGHNGKERSIALVEGFSYSLFGYIFGLSLQAKNDIIEEQENLRAMKSTMERYYRQEVMEVKQVILSEFDALFAKLSSDKNFFYLKRGQLLNSLDCQWSVRIDESDLNNQYPNRYVRMGHDNQPDKESLERAIEVFQDDALALWNDFKANIQEELNVAVDDKSLSADEFKVRKIRLHCVTQEAKHTHRVREEETKKIISRYSDGTLAALTYDRDFIDDDRLIGYIQSNLQEISAGHPEMTFVYSDEADVFANFNKLFRCLLSNDRTPEAKIKLYLLVQHIIKLYELAKSPRSDVEADLDNLKESLKESLENSYIKSLSANILSLLQMKLDIILRSFHFLGFKSDLVKEISDNLKALISGNDCSIANLSELYKALHKYKIILVKQSFYFPFLNYFLGFEDLIKGIDLTLANFEYLAAENLELAAALHAKYEEGIREAYSETYLVDFDAIIEATKSGNSSCVVRNSRSNFGGFFKSKKAPLVVGIDWGYLFDEIDRIKERNQGLSVFDELLAYLRHEQSIHKDISNSPVDSLLQQVMRVKAKLQKEYPTLHPTRDRLFLAKKEESLQELLKVPEECSLTIYPGHSGFDEYYDVVISYTKDMGEEISFDEFVLHKSDISEDIDYIRNLSEEIERINNSISSKNDEFNDILAQIQNLEFELENLQEQLRNFNSLNQNKEAFKKQLSDLAETFFDPIVMYQKKDLRSKISRLEHALQGMQEVRDKIKNISEQIEEKRKLLRSLEKEISKLTVDMQHLNTVNKKRSNEIREKDQKCDLHRRFKSLDDLLAFERNLFVTNTPSLRHCAAVCA